MVKDQKRKERVSGWAGVPIPLRCIGCPYLETQQRWRRSGGKSSLLFKLLK